jgi:ribonuclease HII
MDLIHRAHPQYGWNKNKGYPTLEHKKAIAKYGLCKHHRKTFRSNLPEQVVLDF